MAIWDARYQLSDYLFGEEPNAFLAREAKVFAPKSRILCIGDGEGRNSVYLASLGHQVTSLDISEVGLVKAQKLAQKRGVEIETCLADLADYDLGDARWDGIVSVFCHLPPPLRLQVHRHVPKALCKDGILLLQGYIPAQLKFGTGGPSNEEWLFHEKMLREDFAELQVTHCVEKETTLSEGSGHQGASAVIEFIGKKN